MPPYLGTSKLSKWKNFTNITQRQPIKKKQNTSKIVWKQNTSKIVKSSNHFANEDIEALVVVGYFDPATHSSM